jgi:hypothetical protein
MFAMNEHALAPVEVTVHESDTVVEHRLAHTMMILRGKMQETEPERGEFGFIVANLESQIHNGADAEVRREIPGSLAREASSDAEVQRDPAEVRLPHWVASSPKNQTTAAF